MLEILLLKVVVGCELGYQFSECLDTGRDVLFYWKDFCQETLPDPIRGFPCDFQCNAGSKLALLEGRSFGCEKCPPNTYNIGGGVSVHEGEWEQKLELFRKACWSFGWFGWQTNTNCNNWTVQEGSVLSGKGISDTYVDSELHYLAELKKPGSLKVGYRLRNNQEGEFYLNVDSENYIKDTSNGDEDWRYSDIYLLEGFHKIVVGYAYLHSNSSGQFAEIKDFELRGTEYAALVCEPCKSGFSQAGSDSCSHCPVNTYYDKSLNLCKACPEGKYSLGEANSVNECKNKQPCTEKDYYYTYTPCINHTRNIEYHWKEPFICNNQTGVQKPSTLYSQECPNCSEGEFETNQGQVYECLPCAEGTFKDQNGTCLACPSGHFAPKFKNFSDWQSDLSYFNSSCTLASGDPCKVSSGWESSVTGLTSAREPLASSTLSVLVAVPQGPAEISFSFKVLSGHLYFFVGDTLNLTFAESKVVNQTLEEGQTQLKWKCQEGDCIIDWISLEGSNIGGARKCLECPSGSVSSKPKSYCDWCSRGQGSNSNKTECLECSEKEYSRERTNCKRCPEHSLSDSNHTVCLLEEETKLSNGTYFIKRLSGVKQQDSQLYSGYWEGICQREKLSLYCHNTFYGPIYGDENYFYLSVGNPSSISMPSYYSPVDSDPQAYAFGVFDKEKVDHSSLNSSETCIEDSSKVVLNTGSKMSLIEEHSEGFTLYYSEGYPCQGVSKRFSTEINFICDKAAGEGWPEYKGQALCNIVFEWRSRYACKLCTEETLQEVKGLCRGGYRTVSLTEGEHCIQKLTEFTSWQEECSVTKEVMKTWPVVLGVGVLGLMFLGVGILVLCVWRIRKRYQRLIEYRMEDRNSENIS